MAAQLPLVLVLVLLEDVELLLELRVLEPVLLENVPEAFAKVFASILGPRRLQLVEEVLQPRHGHRSGRRPWRALVRQVVLDVRIAPGVVQVGQPQVRPPVLPPVLHRTLELQGDVRAVMPLLLEVALLDVPGVDVDVDDEAGAGERGGAELPLGLVVADLEVIAVGDHRRCRRRGRRVVELLLVRLRGRRHVGMAARHLCGDIAVLLNVLGAVRRLLLL
mmetsp:Transcript_30540/g.87253  ORF Transcript_30540/g.87253 Transcript_30540/m.87253 type:complete len:220 (-) Transcript_30540:354-1013(-)